MIKRLYVNNFRCLVAFETKFAPFDLLCGPNGSGKSSVFDALRLIRDLAVGDATLGGGDERDIPKLELTSWLKSSVQEFEIDVSAADHDFEYVIHIEQKADYEKPRIIKELVRCDGQELFSRDLDGVHFSRADGRDSGFPLDWRQAALAAIQPKGRFEHLAILKKALASLLILRPNPRGMEKESRNEVKHPNLYLSDLTSWYRSLSQDMAWAISLKELLEDIWPDFKSIRLLDVGINAKTLLLRFEPTDGGLTAELSFGQLSDGEKALVGLYMIRAALHTGVVRTVLIDEPDNYVGLPELQPWVLSLCELLDEEHQAILISHHPEILNNVGEGSGRYFWREHHSSPSRIGPLDVPDGLTPGEAIARGWIGA